MDHGTADISIVMTAVLRKEEIENMKSDPAEYGNFFILHQINNANRITYVGKSN